MNDMRWFPNPIICFEFSLFLLKYPVFLRIDYLRPLLLLTRLRQFYHRNYSGKEFDLVNNNSLNTLILLTITGILFKNL